MRKLMLVLILLAGCAPAPKPVERKACCAYFLLGDGPCDNWCRRWEPLIPHHDKMCMCEKWCPCWKDR